MLIVTPPGTPSTPESLEARAVERDMEAELYHREGRRNLAREYRRQAALLRRRAADLRWRRTDGVRFG